MKISTSILSIQDNIEENILKLKNTSTDFIHLDVMDGIFVPNQKDFLSYKEFILQAKKPLDIHFMVENVEEYISKYETFYPDYMTFHIETKKAIQENIDRIKKNCKVGLSINPATDVEEIIPYLDQIDLVLVMSVIPGRGGQTFMEEITKKIEYLNQIREEKKLSFAIEVDGGINKDTIKKIASCDIAVVGSYITNAIDYEQQIRNLF